MGLCQPDNNYQNYCISVNTNSSQNKLSRRDTMQTFGKTNKTISFDESTSVEDVNAEADHKTLKTID